MNGPSDQVVTEVLSPLPRRAWLNLFPADCIGDRRSKLPQAYKAELHRLEQLLNSDRRWWDWWESTRGGPSTLVCHIGYHDQEKVRASLRSGRDYADQDEVTVQLLVPILLATGKSASSDDDLSSARAARRHVDLLLGVVKRKLKATAPTLSDEDLEQMETARREQQRTRDRASQQRRPRAGPAAAP
jgi:hypothetical protein